MKFCGYYGCLPSVPTFAALLPAAPSADYSFPYRLNAND